MTTKQFNGILRAVFGGAAAVIVLIAFSQPAQAIPAFARRYETACTTCHVLPPKLNSFGMAFKNNGYRIPGEDENFVKQPDVPMGAPAWKQVWPKGVWPGAIWDRVPLSGALELVTDVAPSEPVKVDFAFPEEMELLTAGTLGSSFSFFGDLAFEFADGATEVGLERAHLNIQPFSTHLFNLKLGRIEIGATPFSRFTYKLTDQDFIISDSRAVDGGFRFRSRQQGIELWGANNGPKGGGFQYSAGVVNGSGDSNDDNSHKDIYGSASYKLGGLGVTGGTGSLDTLNATENYIDNSVELGVFSYLGRSGATSADEVRFNRVGFKVNAYVSRLNLFGAYVHGSDLVLARGPGKPHIASNTWFLEGDTVLLPWVLGIVRYDQGLGERDFLHVKRLIPGVSMMLRANVVLSLEAPVYFGDENKVLNGEEAHNGGAIRLNFYF